MLPLMVKRIPSSPIRVLKVGFLGQIKLTTKVSGRTSAMDTFNRTKFNFIRINALAPQPRPNGRGPHLFQLVPRGTVVGQVKFGGRNVTTKIRGVHSTAHFRNILNIGVKGGGVAPGRSTTRSCLAYLHTT